MELLSIWDFLEDPAKMTGALVVGIGVLGLLLILTLYPLSKDR
jgi:hypothetical protein